MTMVLQETTTFLDGRKPERYYAVIRPGWFGRRFGITKLTKDKSEATGIVASHRDALYIWALDHVQFLNSCSESDLEEGEASRFYALRYRRPSGMKRVSCCRCGKRFYAYIDCNNPQYENRVCSKCAIQKGEKND